MAAPVDRRGATPPDFLVKLLTMVGDEAPDLISWAGGKLYIHDPVALERKMSVYFRHSNFSSFQRQLNNFGFRKVEGKGKLAPCMYMHDELVGRPPEAILTIRRKPATSAAADRGAPDAKRQRRQKTAAPPPARAPPPPVARSFVSDELPPYRPPRPLEAFTGVESARPIPLPGMPQVPRDQYVEAATQLNDSFESGLLLSFLEASDAGAIAPSLLSQLAGGDNFYPPAPRPPPQRAARPAVDTSDWPGAAFGGDFGAFDEFNLFGKKMNFAADDPTFGSMGYQAQPRMSRAGSHD